MTQFFVDLAATMQQFPIIIFTEEDPEELLQTIKVKCSMPGTVFELVVDDKKAADLRKNSDDRLRGVFVLDTRYCRGYDMKLGVDARVLIIAS